MTTSLDLLKQTGTVVVSDSGDFESLYLFFTHPSAYLIVAIDVYKPQDATTNPSLILQAVNKPAYASLVTNALKAAKEKGSDLNGQVNAAVDLLVSVSTSNLYPSTAISS